MTKIRQALDKAGYQHVEATEENLVECFRDYADAGYWSNLSDDDVEDLSVDEMVYGLLRMR
jgi:rRNA maturation endonuclease Nob1